MSYTVTFDQVSTTGLEAAEEAIRRGVGRVARQ